MMALWHPDRNTEVWRNLATWSGDMHGDIRKGKGYTFVLTVATVLKLATCELLETAFLNSPKTVHLWGKVGEGRAAGRLLANLHLGWAPAQQYVSFVRGALLSHPFRVLW